MSPEEREHMYEWIDTLDRAIRIGREGGATPARLVISKENLGLLMSKDMLGHDKDDASPSYRGLRVNARTGLGDAIIVVADSAAGVVGYRGVEIRDYGVLRHWESVLLPSGDPVETVTIDGKKYRVKPSHECVRECSVYVREDGTKVCVVPSELPAATFRSEGESYTRVTVEQPADEFDELVVKVQRRRSS